MKKALIFALLSFGMVLGGVSHAKEYKSMTVRIACSTPPGSVQAVPLARLAEIVHKESNGKIKCELYTGGVLGDEQAVVKQLRSNEIQMGVLAAGNLTPFAPKATLVILPYMFPSKQHAFTFFRNEAFMKTFNEAITEQSKTRPLADRRLPRTDQFQTSHQDHRRYGWPQVARSSRGVTACRVSFVGSGATSSSVD